MKPNRSPTFRKSDPKVRTLKTAPKKAGTMARLGFSWGSSGSAGSSGSSESDEEAADDPLWRPYDEQLVVHRAGRRGIAEQVPDADEHLPSRPGQRERQRLVHLQVEPRVESRPRELGPRARISGVDLVEQVDAGRRLRDRGVDR